MLAKCQELCLVTASLEEYVIPMRLGREGSYEGRRPAQTGTGVARLFTASIDQAIVRSLSG